MTLDIHIPAAGSLKEKRFVIKSITDRVRNKFNVSVAEIDANNLWQRCVLAVAMVSNETVMIHKVFGRIRDLVVENHEVELIDSTVELL